MWCSAIRRTNPLTTLKNLYIESRMVWPDKKKNRRGPVLSLRRALDNDLEYI